MMRYAALFPGQGSQHVGMGRFLFENFRLVQHRFEEASDILKIDFKKMCFNGPEEDLALTENTQPAIVLVSFSTYEVVHKELGINFKAAAGHSVGEYSALLASNVLSFPDALRAVRQRGQAMQQAVPVGKGAMVAVLGLDDEEIFRLCKWAERESFLSPIEPANFNAPGQVVLSGSKELIDWVTKNYDPEKSEIHKKVKFIPLKVSAPFHCQLMKPAQLVMEKVLNEIKFNSPIFPIVQNVDGHETVNVETLRSKLIEQVSKPVLWVKSILRLLELNSQPFIELGSGQVLSGLSKKIDRERATTLNINSMDDLKKIET